MGKCSQHLVLASRNGENLSFTKVAECFIDDLIDGEPQPVVACAHIDLGSAMELSANKPWAYGKYTDTRVG